MLAIDYTALFEEMLGKDVNFSELKAILDYHTIKNHANFIK
ncbi:MAG: hypothetical protein AB8B69_26190 [Chitinophagales bacterium]